MKIKTFGCDVTGTGTDNDFSELDTKVNNFLKDHDMVKIFVSESISDNDYIHTVTILYDD